MVDWLGTRSWMKDLSWSKSHHWAKAKEEAFHAGRDSPAGRLQSADGLTFLQIFNAGHLVPFDQPEASLAMVLEFTSPSSKWREIRRVEATVAAATEEISLMLPALVSISFMGLWVIRKVARRTDSHESYVLLE